MKMYDRFKICKTIVFSQHQSNNVLSDPDWVQDAVNNHWYSISKSKGIWWIYLPYLSCIDYLGFNQLRENSCKYLDCVMQTCQQVDVKAKAITYEFDPPIVKAKFYTSRRIDDFISLMALNGYTYVPSKAIYNFGE